MLKAFVSSAVYRFISGHFVIRYIYVLALCVLLTYMFDNFSVGLSKVSTLGLYLMTNDSMNAYIYIYIYIYIFA